MTPRFVLALCLGLVIGLLAGYFLAPEEMGALAETRTDARQAPSASSISTELVVDPGNGDRQIVPMGTHDTAPMAPPRAVEGAIARTDGHVPTVSRGTGVVQGVVRDVHGDPVEGVTVVARVEDYGGDRMTQRYEPTVPWASRSIEDVLDETAKRWIERKAASIFDLSDAEGRFRIDGLDVTSLGTNGNLVLEVFHADYSLRSPQWNIQPNVELELIARRIVPVEFDVRAADGSEPEHVEIFVEMEDSGSAKFRHEWSPRNRTVRLLEGEASVFAAIGFSGGGSHVLQDTRLRALGTSESALVSVHAGMPAVELIVESSDAIVVELIGADTLPPGFFGRLHVQRQSQGDEQQESGRYEMIYPTSERSVIGAARPGTYQLRLLGPTGSESLIESTLQFEGGAEHVQFRLPKLDVREPRRVRVLSAEGDPVERVSIQRAVREENGRLRSIRLDAQWRGVGWYEVWFGPRYAVPGAIEPMPFDDAQGPELLMISSDQHGRIEMPFVADGGDLDLAFPARARATLVLPLDSLTNDSDQYVQLGPTDSSLPRIGGISWREYTVGPDGRVALPELFPGEYQVQVVGKGRPVRFKTVTLSSGESVVIVEPVDE